MSKPKTIKVWAIRETWRVGGVIEKYDERSNPKSNLQKSHSGIKKFIVDWIETWKENSKDSDYQFLNSKTDFKTFAMCRIKTGEVLGINLIDSFSLKVVPYKLTPMKEDERRNKH